MSVSPYFRHISAGNEQTLVDNLVVESIKQRGIDLMYIPRSMTDDKDYLFGEDAQSTFTNGVTIEMYPMNMQGFEGEGDFMAGFGLDIRDEASFIISKTRFMQEVAKKYPNMNRPLEGDLIIFPMAKAAFEITFVEHEKPFYQIGKGHVYELSCKRFEYSYETMEDNEEISNGIPSFLEVNDSSDIQDESDTFVNFDEKDPFSESDY